ncbi:MAG: shikimate kinase [Bacteroidota bacterium]
MPGSGKSSWGKQLAKRVNYAFVDLDDLIEQEEKQSIITIFQTQGEAFFRELEHKYLLRTTRLIKTIVSCGGGTASHYNNMELMNKHGKTIYLNASKGLLADRIFNAKKPRPMFKDLSKEEIEKKIDLLLSERESFFKLAQYTFSVPQESLQSFVNKASWLI